MEPTGGTDMRFKTQLGLHPAWTRSIHIPAALLLHFRALGLDSNTLVYVLQIIAAYWRGEEANHGQIAQIMGVSDRSLRNYNAMLQDAGLITINGRYLHGNRLENDYDLTPLLDSALMLDATNQQQQQSAEKNAYKLVQSLVNAMEAGDDVSGLLADLARQWREITLTDYEPTGSQLPVETGNQLPVETGNQLPVETGNPLPVSIGNQLPVSIGSQLPPPTPLSQPEASFRLKPEASFLSVVVVPPNNNSSLETTTTTTDNTLQRLNALGITNGDCMKLLTKAAKHFGDDAETAVVGWLDYCASQPSLTNPAGLIIKRIKSGEAPPPPASTPAPAPNPSPLPNTPALVEI
jgi:hypothetical protein